MVKDNISLNILIVCVDPLLDIEDLIRTVLNMEGSKRIYVIASANIAFVHEIIKKYESVLEYWSVESLGSIDEILAYIKKLKLPCGSMILPNDFYLQYEREIDLILNKNID